jgi:UDP-N-acetylenolpyruvoylglucosamine reductase
MSHGRYTTFRAGSKWQLSAAREPTSAPGSHILPQRNPYLIIGKSNLPIRTRSFGDDRLKRLPGLKNAHEKNSLRRERLKSCLLQYCTEEGLSRLEFLAGVPGTVGGSVTMNAGAWAMDVGSVIREIRLLTLEGYVIRKDRAELDFSYRRLAIPSGSVVLTAGFTEGGAENHILKIAGYKQRKKTAIGIPEHDSVFRILSMTMQED